MNLIRLWYEDGQEIDLSKYGLIGLRLIIPSPQFETYTEELPGRPGTLKLGKDLRPRYLTAEFKIDSNDYTDSLLLRDELYSLFSKGNFLYIGEKMQPGKRWHVECVEQWNPERINLNTMRTTIPFVAESGMAESVGTTLDPFTFDAEVWQVGQGLTSDDMKYVHNTNLFNIYNAGNETVNPRNMELLIEYKGASTNLSIKNETTGDEWIYTGTSNSGDSLKLDGIQMTKNNLSIFRNTNKKLISLVPGWNGFRLSGTVGSFEIKFSFRFHYL
ncbi:phage tail family protein [Mesobacillus subterraneus]|uniref:phage tail family protein n=1 Tax=Mesobacillus subterraneus TaxID=285983 RepID=UPI001CFEC630|nr:phage tail family protein [Mesobacillus subterraneus]WLR53548.1 phage tail family protein [Mesobacillus subterraneus]